MSGARLALAFLLATGCRDRGRSERATQLPAAERPDAVTDVAAAIDAVAILREDDIRAFSVRASSVVVVLAGRAIVTIELTPPFKRTPFATARADHELLHLGCDANACAWVEWKPHAPEEKARIWFVDLTNSVRALGDFRGPPDLTPFRARAVIHAWRSAAGSRITSRSTRPICSGRRAWEADR